MTNPVGNPNIKDIGFGSKSRTKEQDDEYRSRIKGVPKKRKWTKEKCTEELDECLTFLKKILKEDEKLEKDNPKKYKQENIRDVITLMNKILDFMRYLYPPVQQNLNVNVETTSDDIIDRLKNWKKEQLNIKKDA